MSLTLTYVSLSLQFISRWQLLLGTCYCSTFVSFVFVDVSQSLRLIPPDKDNRMTSGLCRSSGNLCKTSASHLTSAVTSRHLRQSSAESAAIFHHHRLIESLVFESRSVHNGTVFAHSLILADECKNLLSVRYILTVTIYCMNLLFFLWKSATYLAGNTVWSHMARKLRWGLLPTAISGYFTLLLFQWRLYCASVL